MPSLLRLIKAQLGISNTASNNFVLTAEAEDGTIKLARGNAGATTQDILTVNSGGVVKMPQNLIVFSAYQSTLQSVTSPYVKVTMTAEDFDTANAWDTVNSRFQPNVAGYYQINACVTFATESYAVFSALYKNGAVWKRGEIVTSNRSILSCIVYLNGSTDYVELYASSATTQNSVVGSDQTTIQGYLLGAA